MRVFITGGTGWVGSGIVRELVQAGHSVEALVRSSAGASKLATAGATPRHGDLGDLAGLRAAAAGADAVIHCAFDHAFGLRDLLGVLLLRLTRNPSMARFSPMARRDLRATEAIIDGLAESANSRAKTPGSPSGSAKVFVCTSPIAMLPTGRVGTEKDRGVVGSLGGIRLASELAVLAAARRGVRSASLRLPPSVHGAGDTGFVPTLIDIARRTGVSAYPGSGANRWPAVHRDDAAVLYRLAMEQLAAGTLGAGSVLHGVAEEGVPFRELAGAIADQVALGPPAPARSRHFGSFGMFAGIDNPASSELTRRLTGWRPTRPALLDDVRGAAYATSSIGRDSLRS